MKDIKELIEQELENIKNETDCLTLLAVSYERREEARDERTKSVFDNMLKIGMEKYTILRKENLKILESIDTLWEKKTKKKEEVLER